MPHPFLQLLFLLTLVGFGFWVFQLKKRLYECYVFVQNREREREMTFSFLNQIGENINADHDLETTFSLVLDFCRMATKADAGSIWVRDPEDKTILRPVVVQGLFPPLHEVSSEKLYSKRKYVSELVKKETVRLGEGIIGLVAEKGESLLIPHAKQDFRVPKSSGEIVPLEGLILVPLVIQKEVEGVLVLINKRDERNPEETFDEVDLDLVSALADQAAVTLNLVKLYEQVAEKQRIEQELRLATEFQQLLLPQKFPEYSEVALGGMSQPALEVGGDYYDFLPINDHYLGFVIADVSGKGIPGALVMATLRSTLRAEARNGASPKEVLCHVNALLVQDTKENVFVSVLYGILDVYTGRVTYCRAGHEPLIVLNTEQSSIRDYEPEGMVVGMVDNDLFSFLEEHTIQLQRGETLVLYTDGVTEALNEAGEEFGMERFHNSLRQLGDSTPQEMVDSLEQQIRTFSGGRDQHDDITLVLLTWNPQTSVVDSNPPPQHIIQETRV
ncbi:MAG: GAF domain-containing SpoIIE family protein phosphatase [Candidatus Sumerlaeia bacterium]|nr:GAF domain-containing SpoIIE family protein phosphatase [Candidatus Sumerlaeia bacterium]